MGLHTLYTVTDPVARTNARAVSAVDEAGKFAKAPSGQATVFRAMMEYVLSSGIGS